ncbi:MAG: beta-ketoacyl synthase N-terminal-like domain-containing protein, partial [Caulobacteraceae bacterium]
MREAVIVSAARTPIGKAYRGAFNNTGGVELASFAVAEAVRRSGVDPSEVEDVVLGCATPEGTTGNNIAHQAALRAGLPVGVAGMTVQRACSSGLMGVATAAKQIVDDQMQIVVGGGVESISLVQNEHSNRFRAGDAMLRRHLPQLYMAMLETAEIVAERYGVSREAQDEYAFQSQQRTAKAQSEGRHDREIAPVTTTMLVTDKQTGETSEREVT